MAPRVRHSGGSVTILAEAFLDDLRIRGYSPRTIEIWGQALRDFGAFLAEQGVQEAQNVTSAVVEQYRLRLQARGFSAAGEETYCRGVKRFFDHQERQQRVFENPFAGMGPIRRARTFVAVPTEAEIAVLLGVPDVATPLGLRARAILEVAYSTAARLGELAHMTIHSPDLRTGTLRIMGKGRRERVVPLGSEAVAWLGRYIHEVRNQHAHLDTEALWVGCHGRSLGSVAIGWCIRQCARKAGTATLITPHGLRRACATHMLARGAHPVQLQLLLGHTSLRHLSTYLRVRLGELVAMHARSRPGE